MKIDNYRIGTTLITTCAKRLSKTGEVYYRAFGISKKHANIYGEKPENVINCKLTIIEEDVLLKDKFKDKNYDENCIDYFGVITWEDDGSLRIGCIQHNIKLYNMCFPYVIDNYRFFNEDFTSFDNKTLEEIVIHKKGDRHRMTVRLKVEEI